MDDRAQTASSLPSQIWTERRALASRKSIKSSYGVPSVAFTIPPIAAVGLSEAEARAKGLKFRMHSKKVADWDTALRLNESVYGTRH
jgi:pyruvate/2-oxoglutarate dehydrogenase complex dihydrolipoamide dehydrogenase (E3) component